MDSFQHRYNETAMELGLTPPELANLAFNVNRIMYYVSIGLCVMVGMGYLFIRRIGPQYDRLSLRLLVYASVTHIVMGVAGILRTIPTTRGPRCRFIMFLYIFTDLFSTFLIVCMSANLQIFFVHEVRNFKYPERTYVITSFLLAFIISISPEFAHPPAYDFNESLLCCWYLGNSNDLVSLWTLMTLYFWICLSITYSVVALILVLIKMHRTECLVNKHLVGFRGAVGASLMRRLGWLCFRPTEHHNVQDPVEEDPDVAARRRAILNMAEANSSHVSYLFKSVARVVWYPIVLIISRVWGMIQFSDLYHRGQVRAFYTLMSNISVPLQGIILFILFMCDPALHKSLYTVFVMRHREPEIPANDTARNPDNLPPELCVARVDSWTTMRTFDNILMSPVSVKSSEYKSSPGSMEIKVYANSLPRQEADLSSSLSFNSRKF
ncbi:hypothetical protein BCR43DRAFT_502280 [Syncephalastrum racemosum]|uniref:G-protein coupled receptors family 1 profile domain-containing protein n=1 Tax=Syncephalastrum racemosum TaxID=13706 RepID=A0A1X2HMN9_SYNRA|nr:hypothetical protein BCR43DRAFT_502280 [Syncephalastrum racemosum]